MLCKYATAAAELDEQELADVQAMSGNVAARFLGIGATTVKDHRRGECMCGKEAPAAPEPTLTGKVDTTPDGGEFIDVQTTKPVTDWTDVFARFNLDPNAFTIEGDTVRCSTWQQSKALEDGTRDVVNLFSYRARFKRRAEGHIDYDALRASVRAWKPATAPQKPSHPPVTYVVGMADWQLGKSENGHGTSSTLARLATSLANIESDLDQLAMQGIRPERLLLANLGDHTEGVQGSYASQTHSVDLNTRDQINLALEVNLAWIKALAPRFEHVTYAACLCNHGQLARGAGRDNVTDDSDNATGLIGDTLRTICKLHPDLAHVEFNIPRGEMITTVNVSGINIAMAHGHKIGGNEETWLAKQSQTLTHTQGFIPQLWFTAHRHSAAVNDYGPYTRIQATTVDPGSKWFTDTTGSYARPGTTTFLAGATLPGRWDHYRIH